MTVTGPGDESAVLVFSSDVQFRHATVSALQDAGVGAGWAESLAQARQYVEQAGVPLVVLADAPHVLARICRDLRVRRVSAGIVAVGHYAGVEQRMEVLQHGADVCLNGDLQAGELAAQLQALARRMGASLLPDPVADTPAWELADDGWSLLCPDGTRLALSAAEREFMRALLSAPQACIRREPDVSGQVPRHMDMTVSRLRSKAARLGVHLPVRTIRGWGYTFTGEA
ncbi:hypothetical protein V8Z80_08945 [Orrella sp. JC864]|uniref:hypothetical protein n=1 Tax=Orrella sp. JC864 TaxID=3120298 RepID=UPI00300BD79E